LGWVKDRIDSLPWLGGVERLISRVDSLLGILLHGRVDSTNLLVNRSAAFGALESVFVLRILP
jgi:hypothetical protein